MITIRVRWLGNASIEIFGDKHILIDLNPVVDPEKEADILLLTHEHEDHFDSDAFNEFGADANLYAPRSTLEKFDLEGNPVNPGDELEGIVKVLESDCWKSEESVSYFYRGVLHSGDSASFPDPGDRVRLLFSACFPDNYDDYVEEFKRLEPELVIPFHYDPREGDRDAKGLKQRLDEENIRSKVMEAGESLEIPD
ncbi:Zn-dependent hydrolase [candidate division MSBL1 archaeon SCGC-AAA259I09]|uniref:Zn-dependent hydrolase n=2 Tax=candidate division MSBL1 TaxID=215777 RepID=A0A133UVK1_9EURY|nr:Zn-dependent hydrolase [candidate division MSBL1 archaeon SCGC-AAA259I07]KXA98160.1 Zn-dependent hydrolase [candidate division MSBL1 archaeon SCGC-AAA259I09]